MTRSIKFRVWHKEHGEMVHADTKNRISDKRTFATLIIDVGFSHFPDADEWILMQFTGLCDVNGKEIYESDIVKLTNERGFSSLAEVLFVDGCFEVKFQKGLSVFEGIHYQYTSYRDYVKVYVANHAIEVIGNIYENPSSL